MTNLKHFERTILEEMSILAPKLFAASEKLGELKKKNRKTAEYIAAVEEYAELCGRNDALHELLTKIS